MNSLEVTYKKATGREPETFPVLGARLGYGMLIIEHVGGHIQGINLSDIFTYELWTDVTQD